MKYLHDAPFSTPAATDAYRDGWDRVFGKKIPDNTLPEDPTEREEVLRQLRAAGLISDADWHRLKAK